MEHQPAHRSSGREGAFLTQHDTIAAAATPPGRGGIGIVRLSGRQVEQIARGLLGELPAVRRAHLAEFRDATGAAIDRGLALFFKGPHSYTGEDTLELQGHGGIAVMNALMERVLELGARRAQPGEFTQRAYLNGKLDLAQAEAVADLIDASSSSAARAALRSLEGEFSRRVHELAESLTQLRVHVEAAIDFPEEEIDFLADTALHARAAEVGQLLTALLREARQGRILTEGLTVVIAGAPNAGKSTLLNRLAGYDAAIVTDVPGTTRDLLRERLDIDGLPLHVIDTAGLRDSHDPIEREGMRRATEAMGRADRVLLLIDASAADREQNLIAQWARLPSGVPVTLVFNKIDRAGAQPPSGTDASGAVAHQLAISALTGCGHRCAAPAPERVRRLQRHRGRHAQCAGPPCRGVAARAGAARSGP